MENMQYYSDLIRSSSILKLEELKNKVFLVTGACGMIGSCIVDMLLIMNEEYNLEMRIYANARDENRLRQRFGQEKDDLRFVVQDIVKPIALFDYPDYIIHAASLASPESFERRPVDVMLPNLIGTQNLLEMMRRNEKGRMVFVSSGEVYGDGGEETLEFKEDYSGYINTMTTRACYPSSKRAAETLCVCYGRQYDLDTVVARPCHTYGQTMTRADNRAVTEFLRKAGSDNDIVLHSLGNQVRNYCYVADMAAGILLLCQRGKRGEAYNIAPDNAIISIRDLANTIAQIANVNCRVDIDPNMKITPIRRGVLSSKKIKMIGWNPQFELNEALEHVLEYIRGIRKS